MLHPRLAIVLIGCVCSAHAASAQASGSAAFTPPSTPADSTGATGLALVHRGPPLWRASAVALGSAAVLSLADGPIMRGVARVRTSDLHLQRASAVASALGGIGPLALGTALWGGGALASNDFVEGLGRQSTEAVLLSGAITIGVKGLIGRARPSSSPDDPDSYSLGHGFFNANRASFPSGHTSAAFAMATVLSSELAARHPKHKLLIRGVLFAVASSVGLSRMYQNAHWPSDVVTGAALGTLSGMQTLSWHRGKR
ncbi:MAG: phosphatase PAP2 family protein [Gemmatimonadaceae bacterium]